MTHSEASDSSGSWPEAVSELVKALAEERDCTSLEIAETLWLAMQIQPTAQVPPDELQSLAPPLVTLSASATVSGEGSVEEPISPLPLPPPEPKANITAPTPQAGVLPPHVLPVWLTDPAMLTDSLAIIRALRPLLQKAAAGPGKQLDEPATVDAIARTRLCLPILEPEQEPWFDIILVVDRGSSMHIWQRLVKDVVQILRRYGAFRDVRVFDLTVNLAESSKVNVVQLISKPQRPGHRPKELIDQRGRRIAIVLSDCAGPYWWDGTLLPMLQEWGHSMPTVVWQMLPPWMWKRTALGRGTAVAISNDIPGAANHRLKTQIQDRLQESDESEPPKPTGQRIAVPIVTSEVRDLARWSLMVAGDRREITPGFLLPQPGGSIPRSKDIEDLARDRAQRILDLASDTDPEAAFNNALETIAYERVNRFLDLASPQAQRLIMLLAAAPVITLPVVRLIRDSMLYREPHDAQSPLPIAEVFLSGLLQRLPGQEDQALERALHEEISQTQFESQDPSLDDPAAAPHPTHRQELVQYDFAPKVRNILLKTLPPFETIEVINSVTAAVERRWNRVSNQDFLAFLTDPTVKVPEELSGLRSFASVTADILEQLGGNYAIFAQSLRQGAEPQPPSDSDIAEVIFPDLEPFEFIDAQLLDAANPPPAASFPPPLQLETFTVITIQIQPDHDPAQPALEPFEFTVARLVKRQPNELSLPQPSSAESENGPDWVVQRQQYRTYRFVDHLPGDLTLEMVSIPRGTFLMGSPEEEPERYNDESPQHEVTVPPFFMGRYPVTQAQWRAVAALPQIEHALDPKPAHFSGKDHNPVEQVSWADAVEFCARLSAHTGRTYRIPTEAEWEYACRAGTTTPFHFGDMITTDLANYNSSAFADGPTGTNRSETTPVNYFGIANAFGLSDMHGNVFEWCADHWHDTYDGAPTDGSARVTKERSARHILRGGSWLNNPRNCRSAYRSTFNPDNRYKLIGFRVCCSAPRTL